MEDVAMRVTVEDGNGKRVVIDGNPATAPPVWDGTGIAGLLVKAALDHRYTLHCAYPAAKPDTSRAADGFRDFARPETVRQSAWRFIKSPKVGLWHANGTTGSGEVVESYIYQGPDWEIPGPDSRSHTIKSGDWLVGIQWSPETWPLVLSGKIQGVSIQGKASRSPASPEVLATLRH